MILGDGQSSGGRHRILFATLIAGTLDIAMAVAMTAGAGKPVAGMLRGLASGPVPAAAGWGAAGASLGLAVHYSIMMAMAAIFMFARDRIGWVRAHVLAAAAGYGVVLWLVMYGLVLPLRFGLPFPSHDSAAIAKQLFAHVILVGLTFGLVARRGSDM